MSTGAAAYRWLSIPDPNFISDQYLGLAQPIIGRTVQEVKVDDKKLKAAQELCLLRDSSVFWMKSHILMKIYQLFFNGVTISESNIQNKINVIHIQLSI